LDNLQNFKQTLNLECLLLIDNNSDENGMEWSDYSINNHSFTWSTFNYKTNDFYKTNDKILTGPKANKIDNNLINEFTIILLLEILPNDLFLNNKLLNNKEPKNIIDILDIPGNQKLSNSNKNDVF